MNEYEKSKFVLSEKVKQNYREFAVAIAEEWNKAMDKLKEEEKMYVIEIKGECKEMMDEICEYLEEPYQNVVALSIFNLREIVRACKRVKALKNKDNN